ncbi:MAG: peptidylprolyl isomerase [Pseudomonadota bacterium]
MFARLLGAFALTAAVLSAAPSTAQTLFRPVAVVNDSAITGFDLAQRAQILVALGVTTASADALRNQALDQLVEDRLKLQAGRRIGLQPSPEVVEQGIEQIAQRSQLSSAEFKALMNAQGVTDQAVEDIAAAEVIWIQVVRSRFADRVEPGEAEIEAELALLGQRGEFEYRIRELGLPLEGEGRSEAQTRALAEQLFNSLNDGGDFNEAVTRFSKAPSAARGGDVGWVTTQQMPPNLLNALQNMQIGEVSRPLDVAGGFSLIRLEEKRSTGATPQADPQLRERIRSRLINVQSARLADGLLQEMRRDALIEVR